MRELDRRRERRIKRSGKSKDHDCLVSWLQEVTVRECVRAEERLCVRSGEFSLSIVNALKSFPDKGSVSET